MGLQSNPPSEGEVTLVTLGNVVAAWVMEKAGAKKVGELLMVCFLLFFKCTWFWFAFRVTFFSVPGIFIFLVSFF